MRFKDRADAGRQLAHLLEEKLKIHNRSNYVVVSLLRGGVIVGQEISEILSIKHLPLVVTKISAPFESELAIGALCYSTRWLDLQSIKQLGITDQQLQEMVELAQKKFNQYLNQYPLSEPIYQSIKNKTTILTDDGVATGATIRAAYQFLKKQHPKKIILAIPAAPSDFYASEFDRVFILTVSSQYHAVSQFYEDFPQIDNQEIKQLFRCIGI